MNVKQRCALRFQQVAPPVDLGALNGAWLWTTAWLASVVGLGGAAIVGQKLVQLEETQTKPKQNLNDT